MSAPPTWTFELRWSSGDLLHRFVDVPDMSLETLMQYMDEGRIDEIPRARTTEAGDWLEHYELYHREVKLMEGQLLSSYDIPQEATITVVLVDDTCHSNPLPYRSRCCLENLATDTGASEPNTGRSGAPEFKTNGYVYSARQTRIVLSRRPLQLPPLRSRKSGMRN